MWRALRWATIAYIAAEFFLTPSIGVIQSHAQAFGAGQTLQTDDTVPHQSEILPKDETLIDQLLRSRANINKFGELYVTTPRSQSVRAAGGAATIGASSVVLLPQAGEGRRLLAIKNESTTASVAICFGSCTAILNTAGNWTVGPGQSIVWNTVEAVPADEVHIIASAATTPVTVEVW